MYPIDDIDAAQLAGLDMQLLFGDYEDRFYDPEFLGTQALRELIPATLCPLQSEEVWRDLVAEVSRTDFYEFVDVENEELVEEKIRSGRAFIVADDIEDTNIFFVKKPNVYEPSALGKAICKL
eukprot:Pgem_evm1s5779